MCLKQNNKNLLFVLFSVWTEAWRQPSEQEVKNLKVCIELTGLRLSKPRQLQHLQELWERHDKPDLCPHEGSKVTPCAERKSKTNGDVEKGARRRVEEERGWSRDTLGYADADAGKKREQERQGSLSLSCSVFFFSLTRWFFDMSLIKNQKSD